MLPNSTSSKRDLIPLKATICTKAHSVRNVFLAVFPQHTINRNRPGEAVRLLKKSKKKKTVSNDVLATKQAPLQVNKGNIQYYFKLKKIQYLFGCTGSWLQHMGSSSLTRDQTQAPRISSKKS